jgi:hypothetical protein
MRNFFLLLCGVLLYGVSGYAQAYSTAAGIRFGKNPGLTVKQLINNDDLALEGIVGTNFKGYYNTLLMIETHKKFLIRNFTWYAGVGAQKGWNYQPDEATVDTLVKDPFGVAGILGLELTLSKINLSIDYNPTVNLVGGSGEKFDLGRAAISIRFVLFERKRKNLWESIGLDKKKRK